ncbi:hypothetical protein DESC_520020 [Desulfosarcina cetonica]|nr:hypothetical protein DESC_520020 [Desulfosarcina cetonica]
MKSLDEVLLTAYRMALQKNMYHILKS